MDCLGHQSAGFSPIDPFGNAYDLHLSVFRVLGLINACILCLFWLRFCFYDQYSSIYTLAYWLRTPNLCQIQHSLPASQIILRKLPLLTHAVTRPRHGSRVTDKLSLSAVDKSLLFECTVNYAALGHFSFLLGHLFCSIIDLTIIMAYNHALRMLK